jgi:hypothetical protein
VDEADDIFLDRRTTLDARYCIGLTATPLSDQEGVEKEFVVNHLGFAVYESGIASEVSLVHCCEHVKDLETFLMKSSNQAKLIYGDNINAKDPLFIKYKVRVRVDEDTVGEILKLDRNDVLIATQPHLMRGLDYRSTEDEGIALFITKNFPSRRTFKQALGRVGRFDEPCKRYMLPSLEDGVDFAKRMQFTGLLNGIAEKAKKKNAQKKREKKAEMKTKKKNLAPAK